MIISKGDYSFQQKSFLIFAFAGFLVFTLPEIWLIYATAVGGVAIIRAGVDIRPQLTAADVKVGVGISSLFFIKLISSLWAPDSMVAIDNAFNHIHVLFWLPLVVFFRRHPVSLKEAEPAIAGGMIVMALWYAVARVFFPASEDAICLKAGGHDCALLGQSLAFLVLLLLLSVLRPEQDSRRRLFLAVGCLCAAVSFAATLRRAEFIVVSVAVFLVFYWYLRDQWTLRRVVVILSLGLSSLGLGVVATYDRFGLIGEEMAQYARGGSDRSDALLTSVGARMEMYRVAVAGIAERPWFGWGAGIKPRHLSHHAHHPEDPLKYSNFHQQFLQSLLEVGVLGGLLCAMIVFYLFRRMVWQRLKVSHQVPIILMAFLWMIYVGKGFFGVTFGYTHVNTTFVVFSAWLWVLFDKNLKEPGLFPER